MIWLGAALGADVHLPTEAGTWAPSRLEVEGPAELLGDVALCAGCHEERAAEWSASAHAHASFDNPWYRHSVEALRASEGTHASRHCGGCHDPALLVVGGMDRPVDPSEPRARVGVTCPTCHLVREVTSDGNASLRIDLTDLQLPFDGSREAIEAHRAQVMPDVLREGRACAGCHRGLLGPETGNAHVLIGMDDQGGWKGSSWAGSDAAVLPPAAPDRATCVDCHVQDHHFAGAHTALAGQTGALAVVQERLRDAVQVRVGAVWIDGRPVAPELADGVVEAIDVVVWNTGTGHRFPGGTLDIQDTWLEVVVDGALSSGLEPGDVDAARFGAWVVDRDGHPERTHRTARIVTAVADRTVPPLGARAVRFALPEPARVEHVAVRLLHRRHGDAMAEAGCAATSEVTLDGCAERPVTEIAAEALTLGSGEPAHDRAWAHALALSGDVQERLDDARPSARLALAHAPDARAQAAASWLLARIEARQGRRELALAAADAAEQRIGAHPAIDRVRGEAHAQVWDWPAAAEAFARVTEQAPGDTAAWRDLARARGSAGDPIGALEATARGLALQPRDPDLLRSQALALQALEDPRAPEALEAWLAHRPPDEAADLRIRCAIEVEGCARERDPVATFPLR